MIAASHGLELVTLDTRASSTYQRIGVTFRYLARRDHAPEVPARPDPTLHGIGLGTARWLARATGPRSRELARRALVA
jgi:hypothetical protein